MPPVVRRVPLPACPAVRMPTCRSNSRTHSRKSRGNIKSARHEGVIVDDHIKVALSEFRLLAKDGNAILVDADFLDDPIALIEVAPDEFHALSTRCTHQGCQVRPARTQLRCPCHGSTYDLDGKVVRGPAIEALTSYDVRLEREVITIYI